LCEKLYTTIDRGLQEAAREGMKNSRSERLCLATEQRMLAASSAFETIGLSITKRLINDPSGEKKLRTSASNIYDGVSRSAILEM
jgi:hypothetical protein